MNRKKVLFYILIILILFELSFLYLSMHKTGNEKKSEDYKSTEVGETEPEGYKDKGLKMGRIEEYGEEECLFNLSENFVLAIAFGDDEVLCPDEFRRICHRDICPECIYDVENYSDSDKHSDYSKYYDDKSVIFSAFLCDSVCNIMELSKDHNDFFEKVTLGFHYLDDSVSDISNPVYKKTPIEPSLNNIFWRIAVAYRLGKSDDSYALCDFMNDSLQEECMLVVAHKINLLRIFEANCENYIR